MSVTRGHANIRALADMSAKNVYFWTAPLSWLLFIGLPRQTDPHHHLLLQEEQARPPGYSQHKKKFVDFLLIITIFYLFIYLSTIIKNLKPADKGYKGSMWAHTRHVYFFLGGRWKNLGKQHCFRSQKKETTTFFSYISSLFMVHLVPPPTIEENTVEWHEYHSPRPPPPSHDGRRPGGV